MIRSRLVGFLGFLLVFNVLNAAAAQRLTIDESGIRIHFGKSATLRVPITNTTRQAISTTLRITALATNGDVVHETSMPVVIRAGTTALQLDVSDLFKLEHLSKASYSWLRLRYRIAGDVDGVVSLSRIAPEPFVLEVISPYNPAASSPYRVQVFARNPSDGKPVPNVDVHGKVSSDDQATIDARSTRTNALGIADLTFDLSRLPPDSDVELEIRGQLGRFTRTVADTMTVDRHSLIVTSTDKPIYQPGEKLRIRALVFDRMRNALKGAAVEVAISDPDGDKMIETPLVTSAFGEAHTEWTIPDNARVGNYDIRVGSEDGSYARNMIWIGRYDLPTFSIDVRQKHPYHLPGQSAEVEVRADYLFGKPVPLAAVRIVRQIDRTWNYRDQKWDVKEGKVVEGTTDRNGLFQAKLHLDDDIDELTPRRGYSDVPYAVFVTDPSTGRTEQRRFWTRITLFPIHLYIAEAFRGSPLEFYIAASYADGRAAECDVEVFELVDGGEVRREVVRTNKYGVAKVRGLALSARPSGDYEFHQLEFRARDGSGNTGERTDYFHGKEDSIRLYTDKTLYRQSEPVAVHLESSLAHGYVIVNASIDGRVLHSIPLQLTAGKGNVVIPASREFRGNVFISAYYPGNRASILEGRRVSFPMGSSLEIDSRFDRKTYAPGEEATLNLQLRSGNRPEEGLFGITVFDKAVEERAKADSEFGGRHSICHNCGWWNYELSLPGLTVADLSRIDRKQPISPDLELAAEMLLARWYGYNDQPWIIGDFETIGSAFQASVVQDRYRALRYSENYPYEFRLPKDEASLLAMVLKLDPAFESLRDPWNNPYRLASSVTSDSNQIEIRSSGADETFGTLDDFSAAVIRWPYFTEYGRVLRIAITEYHARTGGYVRDIQTLTEEVRRQGHDLRAWSNPQGRPYVFEFGVDRTRVSVTVKSQGSILWKEGVDYTAELQPRIDLALNEFIVKVGTLPERDDEIRRILREAGISDRDLTDPWGSPYYSSFKVESGYFDSVTVTSGQKDGVRITPVTRQSQVFRLRSAGADRIEGTSDDFPVFSFFRPISEQSVEEATTRFVESPILDQTYGAVYGSVMDSTGALIPGVSVTLVQPNNRETTTVTGEDGHFLFRNLTPGIYQVRASLPGFRTKLLTGVFVRAGSITRVEAMLEIAGVNTMVEVSVDSESILTTSSASVGEVLTAAGSSPAPVISTPRLREYFPETLLWQPALETGADGKAQVRFRLADSMTTWKAVVIASTRDGRIAVAEQELVAFQPFFVEHDPPKVLTEGDQIALPVVVRSYLDQNQSIELSMKGEEWFKSDGAPSRKLDVKAGEFTREVFPFSVLKPVVNGRQRFTAQGPTAGDAIEKTSTVYPLGREVTQVFNSMFRGISRNDVHVSHEAMPGTVRAELKIYPNLMSHVAHSIEGIMHRPYGCAEQVTSSAYPSLLYLRYAKQSGRLSDPLAHKAKRYLEIAVRMLRGYQSANGGFAYFARAEADLAVTAYALTFLSGAKDFVQFDEEMIDEALDWLINRQRTDGSWNGDPRLTAYIAGVLSTPGVGQGDRRPVAAAVSYLENLSTQPAEPYVTASLALAALHSGNKPIAEEALNSLRSQVRFEKDGAFWNLETNTPFYSWGLPGRLETTAMAVRALAVGGSDQDLVDQGLLFLLSNKDRYGVWFSTQATVRVLDAIVRLVGKEKGNSAGAAQVVVNGIGVASLRFGTREQPNNPVTLDLSQFLKQGANTVEVLERRKGGTASIQVTESHYIPWQTAIEDLTKGPLRLSVRFDKKEAGANELITVAVEAERIGFRGYGMMLAEIGLPPGAEVDRDSLTTAVASSGWELSRYDVLPDRVLVYVWPRAGGTKFEFKFRPRYGIKAHSAASKLYDYYNPEAYSIVPPEFFVIR